ncbi:MAG: hypothetical protein CMJ18_16640 [Phycisphaeraceae bacterium]|nr:hypothetical protein [Phycisphaeraceae bacterium]
MTAQEAGGQQSGALRNDRRIAHFDFEERKRNPNSMPEHWFAIGREAKTSNPNFGRYALHQDLTSRAGHPRYGVVRFDTRHQISGAHSFHVGLNGDATGAFLEVGAVSAVGGSDYQVGAMVRTTRLATARARLVAYFVDRDGRRIPESEVVTEGIRTDGAWRAVGVKLLGDHPGAAWIGIEIRLTQRGFDPNDPLGVEQVVLDEIDGGAWFDDISVWQLPRLVVRTQSDVNVIRAPQRPRLSLEVSDQSGQALKATVTLYDHRLDAVSRIEQRVGAGAPPKWKWTPPLDRFGWYLVELEVSASNGDAGDHLVARRLRSLLWLGPGKPLAEHDRLRFSIGAEDVPSRELVLIPQLLGATGLDDVALSAWSRDLELDHVDERQSTLDDVLHRLAMARRRATLSFFPLPSELARRLDLGVEDAYSLFAKPVEQWRSYLLPVTMRHGQRVRNWQIGPVTDDQGFFDGALARTADQAIATLRQMTPNPRMVLPWQINQSRRPQAADDALFLLSVTDAVQPEQFAAYLEPWTESPPVDLIVHLQTRPAEAMSQNRRITDLALRMLYAWEGEAGALRIDRPWSIAAGRRVELLPDSLLGVFTNLAHLLAGRRVIARLALGDGLECMILDGPAGGLLAAWSRSAQVDDRTVALYLGKNPMAVDIWGNRSDLEQQDGRHVLRLGPAPMFVEAIDPELALFRSAFRIEPPYIESKQVPHQRTITLYNPWPRTISGYMMINEPAHWSIQPQRTFFSIASGQTKTVPMSLRFNASEVAGRKQLRARFDFVAIESYDIEASAPMEVGLPDVGFEANLALARQPSGVVDARVTAVVTNKSELPLTMKAFAILRGHPRQIKPVTGLEPGQSVVRTFRFEDVGSSLANSRIRVGLRELSGPAMLNRILDGR